MGLTGAAVRQVTYRMMVDPSQVANGACRTWLDVPAIRGRVTDAETGEPIARAWVRVVGVHHDGSVALTDSTGAYAISGLGEGAHQLQFEHECYFSITVPVAYYLDYETPVSLNIGLPYRHQKLHAVRSTWNDWLAGCVRLQ